MLIFLSAYQSILSTSVFINKNATDITPKDVEEILRFGENKYHIWTRGYGLIQIFITFLIILPYTYSYVYERKTKVNYFIISRCGYAKYNFNKIVSNAVAGGTALALPELIYYILLTVFARNEILHPFQLYPHGLFKDMFILHPEKYIFMTMILHFIFGFCFAIFAMGITSFFDKKATIYLLPFIVFLLYDIIIYHIPNLDNYCIASAYNFMFSLNYVLKNFIMTNCLLIIIGITTFYVNSKRRMKNG